MVGYVGLNAEQGPGQFEINLANQDPLQAADHAARESSTRGTGVACETVLGNV
jgi:hypothetical protein